MNKNTSIPPRRSGPPAGLLPLVILLLLIFLAIGLWFLFRPTTPDPTLNAPPIAQTFPSPAESAPPRGPIITENRLIFGGLPKATSPQSDYTALRNIGYISGYSEKRRDPVWVGYRVSRVINPTIIPRPKGEFITDLRTQARVTHHDFTGSGYDRGHMAPNFAIATRFGAEAQRETFLLSNICPQAPDLNQKVWEHLEKDEIDYSNRFEEIWIMDGPIFADWNGGTVKKLRSGIDIPIAFYKILIDEYNGKPRVFSVIMPQTVKGSENPDQFLTSIKEIEKEARLDFLTDLDPKTRKELEEKVWPMW